MDFDGQASHATPARVAAPAPAAPAATPVPAVIAVSAEAFALIQSLAAQYNELLKKAKALQVSDCLP